MYQTEEKIELMEVALDISKWAELMFGYFVKANRSDEEKLEQISAFAQELGVLPSGCIGNIEKAKARWIEEAHSRPPSIPQFLQMLREFRNQELNKGKNLIEHNKSSSFGETACAWDGAKGNEAKRRFLATFDRAKTSQATRWVIREWMRENGFSDNKIKAILG